MEAYALELIEISQNTSDLHKICTRACADRDATWSRSALRSAPVPLVRSGILACSGVIGTAANG